MEKFQQKLINLKQGVNIRDLLGDGGCFDIDTNDYNDYDASNDVDFTNFPDSEDHLIPIDAPFNELKTKMELVAEGVWKKIYKEAKKDAESVDFSKHRVTYHRNLYLETEPHPFDSTWLNGKPDVINPHETSKFLEGILDALSSMKEGEQSYFVISYHKMFKEKGCQPRVAPYSDIFCDLKVLKVDVIGDQNKIDELESSDVQKSFADAKEIYHDGRLRAKNLFESNKIDSAINMYGKLKQMLELSKTTSEDENQERNKLIVQILSNMGTCYNLLDEPNKTLSAIRKIEALCDISKNAKILFTKGKALRMAGDYKSANIALTRAYQLAPNNSTISKELTCLDKSMVNYNNMMKKLTEKLFI